MNDNQVTGPAPDSPVWMPSREAARVYGVEPRTIRKWRSAGKLTGRLLNGMWYIGVPREDLEGSGVDIAELEADHGEPGDEFGGGTLVLRDRGAGSGPGSVDLGPMSELISDLTHKAIEANAAAAMWQERASQMQIQIDTTARALESGKLDLTELQERMVRERNEAVEQARREAENAKDQEWRTKSWWKRLLGE